MDHWSEAIATLALGVVGAVIGGAVGGPGGAQLGFSAGTLLGSLIDAPKPPPAGHLNDLQVTSSAYGQAIPWVFGLAKLGGNVIWATPFTETRHRRGSSAARQTYYTSSVSLAVMVCKGPVTSIRKIWAGDRILYDLDAGLTPANIVIRLGTTTQSVITDMDDEQSGPIPAYRNRVFVYLKDLDLEPWDNSIPNFQFLVENSATQTLVSDDFNRADGNIGFAVTGQAWVWDTIQGQVSSNKAVTTGSPGRPNWIDAGVSDAVVQLTVALRDPVAGTGCLVFRLTDEDNNWRFGDESSIPPGFYELWKTEAGVRTTVVTSTQVSATNDALKVVLAGSSIKCYVNGVLVIDTVQTFNQTATSHGFGSDATLGVDAFSVLSNTSTSLLSAVLTQIFDACGLDTSEYDVSSATQIVRGFAITERTEAYGVVEPLLQAYYTDLTETDGQLVTVTRGGASVVTLDAADYGAELLEAGSELEAGPVLTTSRAPELELPVRVDFSYIAVENGYQAATQSALRYTKGRLQEQLTVSAPLLFTANEARSIPERLIYQTWIERTSFEVSLPLTYLYLVPGDVVTLPVGENLLRARLVEMRLGLPGPLQCHFVLDDAAILVQETDGGEISDAVSFESLVTGTPALVAWNGNAGRDEDADSIGLYVATSIACVLYLSRDNGASYQELDTLPDTGTFGVTTSVLAAGTTTGLFDDTNTVDVQLTAGLDSPPLTLSDADVLAGLGGVVIGDEYVPVGTVTALGSDTYRLSHLLRGQRGTDTFWDEHRVGGRVAINDGGIKRVELPAGIGGGSPVLLKAVGPGQTLADVSPQTLYIFGRETREWAGANLTASRDGGLNVTYDWNFRARKNFGGVPFADPPIDTLVESYQVVVLPATGTTITAITSAALATVTAAGHGLIAGDDAFFTGIAGLLHLNGQTVKVLSVAGNDIVIDLDTRGLPAYSGSGSVRKPKRIIAASTTTAAYSSANQVTDFGSNQPAILTAIYAIGDDLRRGYPLQGVL